MATRVRRIVRAAGYLHYHFTGKVYTHVRGDEKEGAKNSKLMHEVNIQNAVLRKWISALKVGAYHFLRLRAVIRSSFGMKMKLVEEFKMMVGFMFYAKIEKRKHVL